MVVHPYTPNTRVGRGQGSAHPQHHAKSLASLGSYMSLLKINK